MDEKRAPTTSGWSFFKVIGLLIGLIGMIGFGLCTLCGVFAGLDGGLGDFWIWVLIGAFMTWVCYQIVASIIRRAREAREDSRHLDP